MRISFLVICIVIAIVLGLIFGWQVRGRFAARKEAAADQKERPIRDAVLKRVRTGVRGLVFGGRKPTKAKPKSKEKTEPEDKKA